MNPSLAGVMEGFPPKAVSELGGEIFGGISTVCFIKE